jgi:predicted transposase/invertase (TIGR01784 family)
MQILCVQQGSAIRMSIVQSPHDKLFKSAMGDLRVAREFFEHYLPPAVQAVVDLSSLALESSTYVDKSLNLLNSDMLYQVNIAGKMGYLYLLCEHQSSVDPLMPFRLWQYIVAIWAAHLKKTQSETLPLVFPMVFYHGQGPYTGPRNIQSLIDAPADLIQRLFDPFHLIDSHDLSDEALREQTWAGIMAFILKHARARDFMVFMKPFINMLNALDNESGSTPYQVTLINYLLAVGKTSKTEDFVDALKEGLSPQTGENVMSIANQLIEHGREQERQAARSMASQLIEEGIQSRESTILVHLLECKFGTIPMKYREQIHQAHTDQLLAWTSKALKTSDISKLFEPIAQTSEMPL